MARKPKAKSKRRVGITPAAEGMPIRYWIWPATGKPEPCSKEKCRYEARWRFRLEDTETKLCHRHGSIYQAKINPQIKLGRVKWMNEADYEDKTVEAGEPAVEWVPVDPEGNERDTSAKVILPTGVARQEEQGKPAERPAIWTP